MATSYKTIVTYLLDSVTTEFDIPYQYLARRFVVVSLLSDSGEPRVLTMGSEYRFVSKTRIALLRPWGANDGYSRIEIRRVTSATDRIVDFADGSILRAYDLNTAQLQALHVSEEGREQTAELSKAYMEQSQQSASESKQSASESKDARDETLAAIASAGDKAMTIALIDDDPTRGDALVRVRQLVDGSKGQTVHSKFARMIDVLDFDGVLGDGVNDDAAGIERADRWCATNGYTLKFPRGLYRITRGIESYADWVGEGFATVGTFPLYDDKQFLVAGQRQKLAGSNILFDGVSTAMFTTARTDKFASFSYVIRKNGRSSYRSGAGIQKMGIILNFDFKDSTGAITYPNNDNSSTAGVGLLLVNVESKNIREVNVGGYYSLSGIVHFGIDPDNTHLTEVRTMGDIGLSVIGDSTGTNSGLNLIGCFIGANDHHSRSVIAGNERWGDTALYIDIPSAAGAGSRNGISMIGGTITTKTNVPMKLARCGAINFTNVVFENASQAGSAQAGGTKRFTGTPDTGDIGFVNCRLNAEQIKNSGALLDTATSATITVIGGNKDFGFEIWHGKSGIRMNAGSEQNFQMTNDPSTITSGLRFRRTSAGVLEVTVDNERVLNMNKDGIGFVKTRKVVRPVASGAVTVDTNIVSLSGGTLDLNTITGTDGMNRVTLMANTSADVITVKTAGGNIRIGTDFVLSGFKTLTLVYNGAFWLQEGGRPD